MYIVLCRQYLTLFNSYYIIINRSFVYHFSGTYNVARKAAMKKADTDQALESEVTDVEKGRGKRRVTKKRHFDYTDNEEDVDDVNPVLNRNKKKKTAIVSSDSDDDRALQLPSAQISGVRERLKALQQKNASTSKDVSGTLYPQKSTSVFDTLTKANLATTSSEPQKEKQITTSSIKLTSDKRLSPMKTPDKTSSNRTFIDDDGCTEASHTPASNRSTPFSLTRQNADFSLSKKTISRNLFPLSRNS